MTILNKNHQIPSEEFATKKISITKQKLKEEKGQILIKTQKPQKINKLTHKEKKN